MRSQSPSENRNAQLGRTLNILRDLDRLGGMDIYELAERYGTTTRTIRRDLDALRDVGLPLVEEANGNRKRWRIAYKQRVQQLSGLLDTGHYLALRVAMGQGGPVRTSSSTFSALEDLAAKIDTAVGPAGRARLKAIEESFHSYEKFAYSGAPPDVLWPLVGAISNRQICTVTYRPPRPKQRDTVFNVLPLRLFAHNGAAYVMCHVVRHDALATLNLQRLRSLKVTSRQGKPPRNFDPAKMENAAFGVFSGGKPTRYVLRFNAAAAPFIKERIWHPSQELKPLRGGGVELRFTCDESYEVSAWVASWRAAVTVIKPDGLKSELAELGEWLRSRYEKG